MDTLGAGCLYFVGRLSLSWRLTSKPHPSIPRSRLLRGVICLRLNQRFYAGVILYILLSFRAYFLFVVQSLEIVLGDWNVVVLWQSESGPSSYFICCMVVVCISESPSWEVPLYSYRYRTVRQICPRCNHGWTGDIPTSIMRLRKVCFANGIC